MPTGSPPAESSASDLPLGTATGALRAGDQAAAEVIGARRPLDLGQGGPIADSAAQATVGLRRPDTRQPLMPAFDEHHPPDAALVGDCVHCGFCLPTCPTYLLWGEEMDSPRGRIDIMKSGLEGGSLQPSAMRHLDQCLGCMACVTACPSGVQYDKLIEATRAQVERRSARPRSERLLREAIYRLFPYPKRLTAVRGPLRAYQASGLGQVLARSGLLARLPDCINQPIVGVAENPDGRGCTLLMHDVGAWLVPVDDEPIPLDQGLRFLDHMAAMHAAFWDGGAEIEVVPAMHRYLELSPWMAQAEAALGSAHVVPRLVAQGWPLLVEVAPRAAAAVIPLTWDPAPLVEALERTPQTFVHGNWKLDNLGTDSDGRTVLLDWEGIGRGAALSDLAWYLAINCRRLPQSKEAAIDAYRAALERHSIDTAPWWDLQLALCLLGALVQFGWEKAFGGYDDELAWWEARAVEGVRLLA